MSWEKLRAILREGRAELERDRIEQQSRCPHDGEPLFQRADGTLFCEFDGVVSPWELEGR